MITTGWAQAYSEISALVKTVWDAGAESASLTIIREDTPHDHPEGITTGEPASNTAWARFSARPGNSNQRSLGNHNGERCYETVGIGTVQLFTPTGDGLRLSQILGRILQDGLRGAATSPGQVWLRNVRVIPIGRDGTFYQTNVVFDFTYYEVA